MSTIGFKQLATQKCLSIGTSKTSNFPFVPNGILMVFGCPNIKAHSLNIGTLLKQLIFH